MDNDPTADEEVIQQPDPSLEPATELKADTDAPADLANQIAYALDGSGVGLPGSTPEQGGMQAIITEGTTGPGEDEAV